MNQLAFPALVAVLAFLAGALVAWLLGRRGGYAAGRESRDVEVSQLANERDSSLEARRRLQHEIDAAQRELAEARRRIVEISEDRAAMAGRFERLTQIEAELAAAREEAKRWNEACQRAEQQATALGTRLSEQTQAAAEREAWLADRFKLLSSELLDQQSQRLTEQNQSNLGNLLAPLREQLGDFRKVVAEVYDKESRERALLKHEIESLKNINQRISEDAVNLTQALKADSKTRGAWGEMVLERLLEMAGLQSGRHYVAQLSLFTADSSKQQRPDVIVRLPDDKDIVIDAKVSLIGWDRFVAATDDDSRAAALKEHLASIRRNIDSLSAKDYAGLQGLRTLDFVLMFVPIEAAFVEAMRADDSLYGYALAKNVSLMSPSTLLPTLRTVAHLWRIEQRSVNQQEFAQLAAQLHDNFAALIEGIQDVGTRLDRARDAHSGLVRRLTEGGRGSVLLKVQKLKELGAPAKKSLPKELLDRAGALPEGESGDESAAAVVKLDVEEPEA
ncbi:MAG TPA: DNA recombination protein RmuC [Rudaea sp.]|nr:DNA recombination protein RmuC [Rudaea sp.]